jgi:hypothetical protein
MVPDTTFLETVTIMPFPTEELFKEAVLAMNIPLDNNSLKKDNLNAELLALMMQSTPMDGGGNYRFYIDQMAPQPIDRFSPRTNPFFNPFNWARFLRDLKLQQNQYYLMKCLKSYQFHYKHVLRLTRPLNLMPL